MKLSQLSFTNTNQIGSRLTRYTIGLISLFLAFNASAQTETIEKNFDVSRGGTLTINSDQGSIEIETWNKENIAVDVRKKARSQNKLDDFEVSFDHQGKNLTIEGDGARNNNVSVKYTIKLPSNYNLDLKTGGGSIEVGDLSGIIKVRTSGGSIDIGNVAEGSVDADTSGGSIAVGDVNGSLKVNTSGGSIKLGKITGTSNIDTSGGSIKLKSGGGDVKAETSGGSINIGPVTGNVDVDTSGGSIDIAMIDGDVKAETSGGSIEVAGSTGKINLDTSGGSIRIDSSGGPIVAETAGGSIKIEQANGSIEADTAGGSIEAEMIATSGDTHIILNSAGGDIELYISESLAATVDARIKISRHDDEDYKIHSDFPLTIEGAGSNRVSAKGTINGGGDRIQLSTTNGDIYIKKLNK